MRTVGLMTLLVLCAGSSLAQTIVYVDAAAVAGGNSGTDWANAYTSLQSALQNAGNSNHVWVAAGSYVPGPARTDSFVLKSGQQLYGGFTNGMATLGERDWIAHPTILSGEIQDDGDLANNSYHVLVGQTNAVINGFIVTGGCARGPSPYDKGGGLFATNAGLDHVTNMMPVSVINCTFTNNMATNGGAIYTTYSSLTLSNCLFDGNIATNGGAVYLQWFSSNRKVNMVNCLFRRNTANLGGALMAEQFQYWRMLNCRFLDNRAVSSGGAIHHSSNWTGDPGVSNCLFSGNFAGGNGGAISYGNPGLQLFDSMFTLNRANGSGGALTPFNMFTKIYGCRFVGNQATGDGGAIAFNARDLASKNNLFAGNVSLNGYGGALSITLGWLTTPRGLLENATFSGNRARFGGALNIAAGKAVFSTNAIFWGNSAWGNANEFTGGLHTCSFSDIMGGWTNGTGNLDLDPQFAGGPTGVWSAVAAYDPDAGQTVLTDALAAWTNGQFTDCTLVPATNQYLQYLIATNTETTITVWGNAASTTAVGRVYRIHDYRLKSKGGRWTPPGWVVDGVHSPCIDSGAPTLAFNKEPLPNGGRVNMGFDGNTAFASKTKPETPGSLLIIR